MKKSPTEVLGEQIRRQRQRLELTSKYVADTAGIKRSSYACLESGRYRWNVDSLLRVQLVLHVPIQRLWPFNVAPLEGDVTDAVLEAECRAAELHWMPDAEWVLDQVSEICQVPVEVLTKADNPKRQLTNQKARRARTVAALLVRDLEGIRQIELAKLLNTDSTNLANACRKARNPGHGYEWDSYERVKERLGRCYLAPPMRTD